MFHRLGLCLRLEDQFGAGGLGLGSGTLVQGPGDWFTAQFRVIKESYEHLHTSRLIMSQLLYLRPPNHLKSVTLIALLEVVFRIRGLAMF